MTAGFAASATKALTDPMNKSLIAALAAALLLAACGQDHKPITPASAASAIAPAPAPAPVPLTATDAKPAK
jgi:hypothetical protein